jgi:glutaredoxin 3
MAAKRKIEIFSAGCQVCQETIGLVRKIACPSCDVTIFDMADAGVAQRARSLGIDRVPAVLVDGKLAACCTGARITEDGLRAEGIGQPIA